MTESPTVEELIGRMLRKTYFVVQSRLIGEAAAMSAGLREHLFYMIGLESQGVLFASGPLLSPSGKPDGSGLTILRANSLADARAIAEADPLVMAGVRAVTVLAWTVNEGRFQISVNLSTSSGDIT